MHDDAVAEEPLERALRHAQEATREALRQAAAQAGAVAAVFAGMYTMEHRELERLHPFKRSEIIAYAVCFYLVGHGLLTPARPTTLLPALSLQDQSDAAQGPLMGFPRLDELPEHVRADMQSILDAAVRGQEFIDEKLGTGPHSGPAAQRDDAAEGQR